MGATTPLNFTVLSWTDELKFVPSITTWEPAMPLAGVKFVIVGALTAGGGGAGGLFDGSLPQLKIFTRIIIMKNTKPLYLICFNILLEFNDKIGTANRNECLMNLHLPRISTFSRLK